MSLTSKLPLLCDELGGLLLNVYGQKIKKKNVYTFERHNEKACGAVQL